MSTWLKIPKRHNNKILGIFEVTKLLGKHKTENHPQILGSPILVGKLGERCQLPELGGGAQ